VGDDHLRDVCEADASEASWHHPSDSPRRECAEVNWWMVHRDTQADPEPLESGMTVTVKPGFA